MRKDVGRLFVRTSIGVSTGIEVSNSRCRTRAFAGSDDEEQEHAVITGAMTQPTRPSESDRRQTDQSPPSEGGYQEFDLISNSSSENSEEGSQQESPEGDITSGNAPASYALEVFLQDERDAPIIKHNRADEVDDPFWTAVVANDPLAEEIEALCDATEDTVE